MRKPAAHERHARRHKRLIHGVAHLALLVGCIVFGFPFYWLLSTSVKEQDELFHEPEVWVPRWPQPVRGSPFFASEEYDPLPKPPAGITPAQVEAAWPTFALAAGEVMTQRYLQPNGISYHIKPEEMELAVSRGLYSILVPRLQPEQVRRMLSGAAREVLAKVVTERDCKTVWDNVHRALALRGITLQDQSFVQYRLPMGADGADAHGADGADAHGADGADAHGADGTDTDLLTPDHAGWHVTSGPAGLSPTRLGKEPATEVWYDFDPGWSFTLEADLPSPMAPEAFRRLTIPLRGDRSWNRIDLEADVGGRRFLSDEPLILFTHLSQEAAWQIPDPDRTGASAFRDYFALREAGPGKAPRNRVHVKLTVTHNDLWGVGWAKARRNFRDAINFVPLSTYFRNTLLLVVLNVIGQLFSCSVVAYSFARLRWPGRDVSFGVLLATMMLPAQVTMIPVFLIYRYLGWYDTLQPLWVGSFFGNAFFIFLLRQFMRTIPRDLEEAAKIDGCSLFGIYWRIILPLMKPALAAVAIFSFMNAWNEFMGPLIYLNDQRLYPLSLGLYQFRIEHSADFGMLMAASALMILPVVVVFFLAQKHFIQGITLTGMKG